MDHIKSEIRAQLIEFFCMLITMVSIQETSTGHIPGLWGNCLEQVGHFYLSLNRISCNTSARSSSVKSQGRMFLVSLSYGVTQSTHSETPSALVAFLSQLVMNPGICCPLLSLVSNTVAFLLGSLATFSVIGVSFKP